MIIERRVSMRTVSQRSCPVLVSLVFLMLTTLFLTGCPKKVSPLGKGSKTPLGQSGSLSKGGGPGEGLERGNKASLQEEEIPSLVKLEKPLDLSPSEGSEGPPKVIFDPSSLADIFFDFGRWDIRSTEIALFEKNVAWMAAHPDVKLELEGHADPRGTNEYNLILGERRAHAVQEYLVQLGMDRSRFLVVSYGEENPFCNIETESCYQENRRVHFRAE